MLDKRSAPAEQSVLRYPKPAHIRLDIRVDNIDTLAPCPVRPTEAGATTTVLAPASPCALDRTAYISGVELGGGDSATGGLGSGVQASVPNGDDQAGVADGQRAGQMDSVGSA